VQQWNAGGRSTKNQPLAPKIGHRRDGSFQAPDRMFASDDGQTSSGAKRNRKTAAGGTWLPYQHFSLRRKAAP